MAADIPLLQPQSFLTSSVLVDVLEYYPTTAVPSFDNYFHKSNDIPLDQNKQYTSFLEHLVSTKQLGLKPICILGNSGEKQRKLLEKFQTVAIQTSAYQTNKQTKTNSKV
jgi:hypothetical protein